MKKTSHLASCSHSRYRERPTQQKLLLEQSLYETIVLIKRLFFSHKYQHRYPDKFEKANMGLNSIYVVGHFGLRVSVREKK